MAAGSIKRNSEAKTATVAISCTARMTRLRFKEVLLAQRYSEPTNAS